MTWPKAMMVLCFTNVRQLIWPCPAQFESGSPTASKPKGIRARLRWMLGKQSKRAIAKQQVRLP